MNIIERNLYRLLRAGIFQTDEKIEPLSAWKWHRLYQMAMMHDIAPQVFQGLQNCRDQFAVQVPPKLMQEWSQTAIQEKGDENDLLAPDRLTNPLLNRHLQAMLDTEDSNTETRTALLHLVGIVRFIMNAGIPVKRVAEFGVFLRQSGRRVDFLRLKKWIDQLQLSPMAQLAALMLVKLFHFSADELPFMQPVGDEQMDRQLRELYRQKNSHAEEWYFSQGKNIFVHTSNPSAMLWHIRRSAKYFRYYPTEMLTNFVTAFAHSLSHIEE